MRLVIPKKDFDEKLHEDSHTESASENGNGVQNYVKGAYAAENSHIKKPENRWQSYSTANFSKKKDEFEREKDSFIHYFCGYLEYYDQVVRSGFINHSIYFDWDSEKDKVTVYIDPKPVTKVEQPELTLTATAPSGGSDPIPPKTPPPPYS